MIYRIFTENKGNKQELAKLVLRRFEGFTISETTGYYKGSQENSLIIEIDTFKDSNELGLKTLAKEIRDYGNQECVLVQKIRSNSNLI